LENHGGLEEGETANHGKKHPEQGKWNCKIVGQRYPNLALLIKMTS